MIKRSGMPGFELLPPGTIDVREVTKAEVIPSKRGNPIVRLLFLEGGVIHLGPLDYLLASIGAGVVDKDKRSCIDIRDIWSLWKHLPMDPTFLVGKSISFKVEHVPRDGVTYQAFRFKEIVG